MASFSRARSVSHHPQASLAPAPSFSAAAHPVSLAAVSSISKSMARKSVEQKDKQLGVPFSAKGSGAYTVSPVSIESLRPDNELTLRSSVLKTLFQLEKQREDKQAIVNFCHLSKAFLLANTHLLHITDMREFKRDDGQTVYKVKVRGISELLREMGEDEFGADLSSWCALPFYLNSLCSNFLERTLGSQWNMIRAVDVSISLKKPGESAPSSSATVSQSPVAASDVPADVSVGAAASPLLLPTKYVYTTLSFVLDNFESPMPQELLPFDEGPRIYQSSKPSRQRKSKSSSTSASSSTSVDTQQHGDEEMIREDESPTTENSKKRKRTSSPAHNRNTDKGEDTLTESEKDIHSLAQDPYSPSLFDLFTHHLDADNPFDIAELLGEDDIFFSASDDYNTKNQ